MRNPTVTKTVDLTGYSDEAISAMFVQLKLAEAIVEFWKSVRAAANDRTSVSHYDRWTTDQLGKCIFKHLDVATVEMLMKPLNDQNTATSFSPR